MKTMKNHHSLWMVVGCVVPLLLIFLAPAFGIGGTTSLFIFILFMFACHLFVPHEAHHHGIQNYAEQHKDKSQNNSNETFIKTQGKHNNHN